MVHIWTEDKYLPIPGEMDTVDCIRKERDELKKLVIRYEHALRMLMGTSQGPIHEWAKNLLNEINEKKLKLS